MSSPRSKLALLGTFFLLSSAVITLTAAKSFELHDHPKVASLPRRAFFNHNVVDVTDKDSTASTELLGFSEKHDIVVLPEALMRDANPNDPQGASANAGSPQTPTAPASSAMPISPSQSSVVAVAPDVPSSAASSQTIVGVVVGPNQPSPQTANVAVGEAQPGVAVGVIVMGTGTYTLAELPNGNLAFGATATVTANAPAATINGQFVSFGANGLVIDGRSTFPITPGTPASPAGPASGTTTSVPPPANVSPPKTATSLPAVTKLAVGVRKFTKAGKNSQIMQNDGNKDGLSETVVGIMVGVFAMLLM